MELHRLRVLRELAARETIAAVAEALAYTPSAISQQLSTLEKEIGVPLLERRGRRVVLTAAGRALVACADDVLQAAERAASAAEAAAAAVLGPVRVGSFASAGATVVPAAFAALRRTHPDLQLHFGQFGDGGLRELKLGHLDVWIDQHYTVLPAPSDTRLVERVLLVEPVQLAVPEGEDRGPLPASYRELPWVGGRPDTACGQLLARVTADAGFVPDVRHLTDDLEVILQLVASGAGAAVLPRLATSRLPEGVALHTLPGLARRVIALARDAAAERPAVRLVLDELEQSGAAIADRRPASV